MSTNTDLNTEFDFGLAVIGSGPAGRHAAIQASKLKNPQVQVCIIEGNVVGGGCLVTDAIPSKAIMEAVNYFTDDRSDKTHIHSMQDLLTRAKEVTVAEVARANEELMRNRVEVIPGWASFIDAHTLNVDSPSGRKVITAKAIIIATGSKPNRPPDIPFTDDRIIDSDGIFSIDKLPRSLIVIGGGIIGVEYACMFAAYGVDVTVVDRRPTVLSMCDGDISTAARYFMNRHLKINFILEQSVVDCSIKKR